MPAIEPLWRDLLDELNGGPIAQAWIWSAVAAYNAASRLEEKGLLSNIDDPRIAMNDPENFARYHLARILLGLRPANSDEAAFRRGLDSATQNNFDAAEEIAQILRVDQAVESALERTELIPKPLLASKRAELEQVRPDERWLWIMENIMLPGMETFFILPQGFMDRTYLLERIRQGAGPDLSILNAWRASNPFSEGASADEPLDGLARLGLASMGAPQLLRGGPSTSELDDRRRATGQEAPLYLPLIRRRNEQPQTISKQDALGGLALRAAEVETLIHQLA